MLCMHRFSCPLMIWTSTFSFLTEELQGTGWALLQGNLEKRNWTPFSQEPKVELLKPQTLKAKINSFRRKFLVFISSLFMFQAFFFILQQYWFDFPCQDGAPRVTKNANCAAVGWEMQWDLTQTRAHKHRQAAAGLQEVIWLLYWKAAGKRLPEVPEGLQESSFSGRLHHLDWFPLTRMTVVDYTEL